MTLGKRLKKARNNKKLTQEEAAKKIGITFQALSNYERDYRDPDTALLAKMAELYDVPTDYLLGRTNNRNESTHEQKILDAVSNDPELLDFWKDLSKRDDLKMLFKQTRDLSPDAIKRIIKYIKMVEDEEAAEEF